MKSKAFGYKGIRGEVDDGWEERTRRARTTIQNKQIMHTALGKPASFVRIADPPAQLEYFAPKLYKQQTWRTQSLRIPMNEVSTPAVG